MEQDGKRIGHTYQIDIGNMTFLVPGRQMAERLNTILTVCLESRAVIEDKPDGDGRRFVRKVSITPGVSWIEAAWEMLSKEEKDKYGEFVEFLRVRNRGRDTRGRRIPEKESNDE
tara:strand:- start:732 stop:1076 length:345 start_codon:yes stop_codon:yes gene_type:complete